jgi:hypothetical protein
MIEDGVEAAIEDPGETPELPHESIDPMSTIAPDEGDKPLIKATDVPWMILNKVGENLRKLADKRSYGDLLCAFAYGLHAISPKADEFARRVFPLPDVNTIATRTTAKRFMSVTL